MKVQAHVGDGKSTVSLVHMLVLPFTYTNISSDNI
jgi:hypothetical protein